MPIGDSEEWPNDSANLIRQEVTSYCFGDHRNRIFETQPLRPCSPARSLNNLDAGFTELEFLSGLGIANTCTAKNYFRHDTMCQNW
jgi:hypothetical protein